MFKLPDLKIEMRDAALAAATNGIVIASALGDSPIVYANAGFERLSGYSADEILGRNCRLLQGPGTDPEAITAFSRAVQERRSCKVEILNYRKDGTPFWNEVVVSPVSGEDGVEYFIGVQLDVTERHQAQEAMHRLAYRDPLTGLANRARLDEHLRDALDRAGRVGGSIALLYLDVDGFKEVNDRRGHQAGDELLVRLAERLSGVVRPGDVLARQGGDEFLIVLNDLGPTARTVAVDVARRMIAELDAPFAAGGGLVDVNASVGISLCGDGRTDRHVLIGQADTAMYAAKAAGGGTVRVFGEVGAPSFANPAAAAIDVTVPAVADELDRILSGRLVRSAFQPLVEIDSENIIGYEALARGPEGSPLERPDQLFAAARQAGRLAELEWVCRHAAMEGALEADLRPPLSVFINLEPETLGEPMPAWAEATMRRGYAELNVVLELTERAVTSRPADITTLVDRLREEGCAIALDDVGADPRSLALMPLVRPEVIKLDLRLVRGRPTPEIAAIVHAVNAEAERSGARIVAEGIEDDANRDVALALGADLAQGWRYGRPAFADDLRRDRAVTERAVVPRVAQEIVGTPFGIVAEHCAVRRGTKRLLLAISMHLEAKAAAHGEEAVLLATFQDAEHFTPITADRYRRLARRAALVAALGVGLPPEPVPGVRGVSIGEGEVLRGEWDVVALSPHFAAAFVARDLGDEDCPDGERRFDFCLTYDRDLVVRAAQAMAARVSPR